MLRVLISIAATAWAAPDRPAGGATAPELLPVPSWPGSFQLPLRAHERYPEVIAPRTDAIDATGLTLGALVQPFVAGGHCGEPHLVIKGDRGSRVDNRTRDLIVSTCRANDAGKLLDLVASAREPVSLKLSYEFLDADALSRFDELLGAFPELEPERNSTASTTAHVYVSSDNASALPEHADHGDIYALRSVH